MKVKIMLIAILFTCSFMLMACSDDNNNNVDTNGSNEGNISQNDNDQDTADNNKDAQNNNNNSNENGNSYENQGSTSSGVFEPDVEDQEGLSIGDTGKFDTTLGSYEMTLDEAELVGPELDGEQTTMDDLILLDPVFVNIVVAFS